MAEPNRAFRFLQLSDALLDARLSFKKLGMPAAKRLERNNEALETLLRMCDIARQRQADALVINGNLWDGQSVTAATAAKLVEAFSAMGDIPVLITPGLSDPYSPQSFFNLRVLAAHAIRPWPNNVHIFGAEAPSAWVHPKRPDVRFFGRANLGFPTTRMIFAPPSDPQFSLNVLLDYQPFDESVDQDALLNFHYAAFGCTPNYKVYATVGGQVRGASSGSLIGRATEELGPRSAIWVELNPCNEGEHVRIERVPADRRMLTAVSVSINGIKAGNVAEHIRKVVEATGARPGVDLVHVRVTGIYGAGQPPETGEAQLSKTYYHVRMDNGTRPDYFIDKADQRTTPGRFIQVLQELKNLAEARGGVLSGTEYGIALTAKDVEDALYYGLEALTNKKVTVPDVD